MNARGGPTGPTGSVLQGPFRSFAARLGGERAGPAAIVTPAGEAGCRPKPAAQVDILGVNTCFLPRRYLCPQFLTTELLTILVAHVKRRMYLRQTAESISSGQID